MDIKIKTVDCACVCYGDLYDWQYVERLYSMLDRHLTPQVTMHVYTEASRPVPEPWIKHSLSELAGCGIGRRWWYKMQLFNPEHFSGPLLYFDLDTVIVGNIDWILEKSTNYFWAVRDFKYLWKPNNMSINSSVMWWDTKKFAYVWQSFCNQDFATTQLKFRGDQDFLDLEVEVNQRRFLDNNRVKSWRWQCLDGGYSFDKRLHRQPGTGTWFSNETSILVLHGNPKTHEILDPVIVRHWT